MLELPGFETEIDASGDEPLRVPVSRVRFTKLSLLDQFMHVAASPAVAYLLFLVGAGLLVFELYTAGVGIAGGIGAITFLLGCYGLVALPARGLGRGPAAGGLVRLRRWIFRSACPGSGPGSPRCV